MRSPGPARPPELVLGPQHRAGERVEAAGPPITELLEQRHALLAQLDRVIPFGAVAGGLAAQLFGLRAPFLLAGLAQLVLVVVTARRLRAALPPVVIDLRTPALVVLPAAS